MDGQISLDLDSGTARYPLADLARVQIDLPNGRSLQIEVTDDGIRVIGLRAFSVLSIVPSHANVITVRVQPE